MSTVPAQRSEISPEARPFEFYRTFVGAIAKRWWVVVVTMVVVITGACIYLARAPRIYEARASIVIDSATPQVLGGQFRDVVDVEMGSWWSAREYIQTQYNVIRSESLASDVARRLEITGQLPRLHIGDGPAGREAAAGLVRQVISVEPVKESRIVNVVIRYGEPEVAQILANAVADTYIDENLERRLSSTRENNGWLGKQLSDLKDQLESSEMALYDFKRQNNVLSVSLEDSRNILSNEIQRLSEAAIVAKTKRIELTARRRVLATLRSGDPLNDPIPEIKENEIISKLKETYVEQSARLLELKGKYLDQHPAVLAQEARLEEVRRQLSHEAELALKAVEAAFTLAVETEKSLNEALEQAKQEALGINKKQIEYDKLKRTSDNNAKLYDLVLGRLKEGDLAGQLRANNIRWLDHAHTPNKPVSPNIPTTLGVSLALSIALGLCFAMLLNFLDNTVKTQDDVENVLRIPFLGLIPRMVEEESKTLAEAPPLFIVQHPKSSVAECCRAIRTNILFMSPDRPLRSLLVTSSGPQEGKSTTAINLGITMAQSGGRVLLIDTDLRRPRIHRAFGVPAERGLSTLILGETALEDVIKATEVPGLWVIPCGPLPPNPAELLHASRFREVLTEICSRFDRVIFDSPPLGAVTDAAVLSTLVDGTMLVAKCARTTRDMLGRARRQLTDVNANVLGCILNDVDLTKREAGYNYYYYYYHRYGYYYGDQKTTTQPRDG